MRYDVTVHRTEHRTHVFRVQAGTPGEAAQAALDEVADYDFHDSPIGSAEEHVGAVVAVDRDMLAEGGTR